MSSSRTILLSIMIAVSLMAGSAAAAIVELSGLRTAADPSATSFYLRFGAPVSYSPIWVDSHTFVLDIAGVSSSANSGIGSGSQPIESPLVSTYRVSDYKSADSTPHVRIELSLKETAQVDAEQENGVVTLQVKPGSAAPPSVAPPIARPASRAPSKAIVAGNSQSPAVQPADVKAGTAIREVQVARIEGSSLLEVQIVGNGAFEYRTMRLTNPERLVLDIPNAKNQVRQKQLSVKTSPLRAVRIGQMSVSPEVSRVVMDLDAKTPFQVRKEANSLVVTLGEESVAASESKMKTASASVPAPAPELSPEKLSGPAPMEESSVAESKPQVEQGDVVLASATPAPEPRAETASAEPASSAPSAAEMSKTETPASQPSAASRPATVWKLAAVQPTAEKAAAAVAEPAPLAPVFEAPDNTPERPSMQLAAAGPALVPTAMPARMEDSKAVADANPAPSVPTPPAKVAAEPQVVPASSAPAVQAPAAKSAPIAKNSVLPDSGPKILLAQESVPPSGNVEAKFQAPSPQNGPGLPKTYTGEPISVNLKDVDLKDFFRLIHEISGLNIVLDPAISGNVTIVLDEVPWDQALEIVLKNNGLGKEVDGSVVRIAKLATLEDEEKQRRNLALAVEQAQPKVTVTRQLSYAKAADLIKTLKTFLTSRGDIISDARTNQLIITDVPGVVPTMDALIHSLDQKSPQVEIEARVVSASRSFARDIGSQLAASGLTGNVILGGTGAVGTSPVARGTVPPLFVGTPPGAGATNFANISQPLLTNLAAAGPTSGFTFLLTAGNFALDSIISAAESKGIGKLLSRPKIITQNNVEATVKQGVKIPLQTTVNNTVSVQYVDVVLRLTVTPQITADGTIFLKTDIENTSIDPGIATTPGQFGLDTQSATTQVLVSDGGTVFFGGVVQNVNRVNESEVPLLGSVPLLGNMFKRKTVTSTTNELLFFITPKIVQS